MSAVAVATAPQREAVWRWPLIVAICLGAFVGMADATIVAVGTNPMALRFDVPLSAGQEVIALYLVVSTAALPTLGRLGDRFGRKLVYLGGFAIFGLGSVICALASGFGVVLVGRAVQAIGGGTLTASSLALIAEHAPRRRTGRSVALMVIMQAVAGLTAPPLGGLLVTVGGWQAMFWVGVPVAAVGIALALAFVPASAVRKEAGMDPVGALLFGLVLLGLGAGIASLDGPVIAGVPAPLWLSVAWIGALLLVPTEIISRHPIVDGRLLRAPRFAAASVASFLSTGTLMSCFALLPFWLEAAHGASAIVAGLAFLPIGLGIGAMSRLGGKLGDSGKTRLATVVGMIVAATGLGLASLAAMNSWWWLLLFGLFVLGSGNGVFSSPNTGAAITVAPRDALGSAAGLLSTARTAGVVVGLSITGALYTALTSAGTSRSADHVASALFAGAAAICLVVALLVSRAYRRAA